jgi:hypothetical protein
MNTIVDLVCWPVAVVFAQIDGCLCLEFLGHTIWLTFDISQS